MDKVCCISQNSNALICSKKEKEILRRLVINFYIRTPKMMEALSINEIPEEIQTSDWLGQLREVLDLMGIGGFDDVVKMAIKMGCLTEELDVGLVFDLCNEVRNLNHTFLLAQNNSFLTGDQPVFIGNDSYIVEKNKQCLYFVLSPKTIVLFGNYGELKQKNNRMVIINDSIVDDFNIHMAKKLRELQGKLIANSEESIRKYQNYIS